MKAFFIDKFEYTRVQNQKLTDLFLENPKLLNDYNSRIFSHVLDAHHIWNNRLNHTIPDLGVWEIIEPENMSKLIEENHLNSLNYIQKCDLNEKISYKTSKGIPMYSKVEDILFHMVNHATHHRGQVLSEIRRLGGEPPVTDYIFYKR
ncbi:MAG: damage-inducible protein DinB [Bacteroidetes bacterium]|nr:damage-inducible protein DinB [Bacteroidota bacterium]